MAEQPVHLRAIDPAQRGIPYVKSKADQLNQLFLEQGVLRERARISPATVEHGLRTGACVHATNNYKAPNKRRDLR